MLKLVKSRFLANTVVIVLFASLREITSKEIQDKYMEKFHDHLHELLTKENITEYVIMGKIKRECVGCSTVFWSGGTVKSNLPIKNQHEIFNIISEQIAGPLDSMGLVPETTRAETDANPNNEINEVPELDYSKHSESYESDTDDEANLTDMKSIERIETYPNEKDNIETPFHEEYFKKEASVQTHDLCQNEPENQLQTGGIVLKFEYLLLSAAFLYVTVVTIVYLIIFCSRPKGYQSGIGSISGDGADMV